MRKAQQHADIFRYLQTHDHITKLTGAIDLHITKVDTRVGEMIRKGYPIGKVWVRPEGKAPYMRYFLTDKAYRPEA